MRAPIPMDEKFVALVKPLAPLINGLNKYEADEAVAKKPKLVALVDAMVKEAEEMVRGFEARSNATTQFRVALKARIADIAEIAKTGDREQYSLKFGLDNDDVLVKAVKAWSRRTRILRRFRRC